MPQNKSKCATLLRTFLCIFCTNLLVFNTIAQPANTTAGKPKLDSPSSRWVDSVYNSLSLEQKIGQLFMVAAYSGGEKYNRALIEKLVSENYIGGLIYMQGTAEAQAEQTNAHQNRSKVPLLNWYGCRMGFRYAFKRCR